MQIPNLSSSSAVGSTSLYQDLTFEAPRISSPPPWLQVKTGIDPVLIGGAVLVVGLVYLLKKKKG